jgi:EmrB/QacA subfamily drug resistance transporter
MAKTTPSAQDHALSFSSRRRTIALFVVALAFVMDLLDSTIVNVAIPSIQTNLGASYSTIQWIVAGYSLAFALLLVTGGRMGDVFGYKKLFMIGVGGFTIASLLSGIAWNPNILIATRLFQGSMAALMVPQVISVMQIMYKPAERGAINGLFGALGGLAASLGPIVGGLLIKANIFNWDWRPIFLINVPVGIFGLIAAARYLPNGKSSQPLKLDLVGTGIVLATLFLLVFPLIQGRELGWPAWSIIMMLCSLPLLVILAWWQRVKMKKDGSPLVVPSLFKKRSFSVGMLVNIIFEGMMVSFFLTFTLVLQIGLGFSPIHAALTGVPTALGIAGTMALFGDKLVPKLGSRSMSIGAVVIAIGLAYITLILHRYGLGVHSWQFIPGLLCFGVGMGLTFVALFSSILNDVDVKHAGSASGVLNAIQQVGGAIGIAVIGVIFFGQLHSAAPASFQKASTQLYSTLNSANVPPVEQMVIVNGAQKCFTDRSAEKDSTVTPASCKQAQSKSAISGNLNSSIKEASLRANADNFSNAFKYGAIFEVSLLAVVFVLSFLLPRHIRQEAMSN